MDSLNEDWDRVRGENLRHLERDLKAGIPLQPGASRHQNIFIISVPWTRSREYFIGQAHHSSFRASDLSHQFGLSRILSTGFLKQSSAGAMAQGISTHLCVWLPGSVKEAGGGGDHWPRERGSLEQVS